VVREDRIRSLLRKRFNKIAIINNTISTSMKEIYYSSWLKREVSDEIIMVSRFYKAAGFGI
jgi:hypothetical protein